MAFITMGKWFYFFQLMNIKEKVKEKSNRRKITLYLALAIKANNGILNL